MKRPRCPHFALLASILLAADASLGLAIELNPPAQKIASGETTMVRIVASGLGGEIVSAYDLDLTYDPAILAAVSVSFGPLLGDPALFQVIESFDVSTDGVVDFAQLSLLSDTALLALQTPPAFTLAVVEFRAIGSGTSPLALRFDDFNDVKGLNGEQLVVTAKPGSVTVTPVIPEPSAALVFGLGVAVVASSIAWRRRPARYQGPTPGSAVATLKGSQKACGG
ncbi:MAG: cohesin domain-containing protein [Myxococcota bacterium]|nr:cohesin domain-containing protein [Myxococcota bacterium]